MNANNSYTEVDNKNKLINLTNNISFSISHTYFSKSAYMNGNLVVTLIKKVFRNKIII